MRSASNHDDCWRAALLPLAPGAQAQAQQQQPTRACAGQGPGCGPSLHAHLLQAVRHAVLALGAGERPFDGNVSRQPAHALLKDVAPGWVAHNDDLKHLPHAREALQAVRGDGLPLQLQILLGDGCSHALAHATRQQHHADAAIRQAGRAGRLPSCTCRGAHNPAAGSSHSVAQGCRARCGAPMSARHMPAGPHSREGGRPCLLPGASAADRGALRHSLHPESPTCKVWPPTGAWGVVHAVSTRRGSCPALATPAGQAAVLLWDCVCFATSAGQLPRPAR